MVRVQTAPRWLLSMASIALVAGLVFAFSAWDSAQGSSHDGPLHACLFAGSLSQVGPTEPANCGRGSHVLLSEGVSEDPAPTTIVRTGAVLGTFGQGRDATITGNGNPGYTIRYEAGVFDPNGDLPVLTAIPLNGQPTPYVSSHSWTGGVLEVVLVTGLQQSTFHFSVVQNVPPAP